MSSKPRWSNTKQSSYTVEWSASPSLTPQRRRQRHQSEERRKGGGGGEEEARCQPRVELQRGCLALDAHRNATLIAVDRWSVAGVQPRPQSITTSGCDVAQKSREQPRIAITTRDAIDAEICMHHPSTPFLPRLCRLASPPLRHHNADPPGVRGAVTTPHPQQGHSMQNQSLTRRRRKRSVQAWWRHPRCHAPFGVACVGWRRVRCRVGVECGGPPRRRR